MSEVEQLKKRIDDSGVRGVETAHIRDDYEPVGAMMVHDICASGLIACVRVDGWVSRLSVTTEKI